ncbi:MAG TPA: methyltransferase domain-containing protein [Nitrospirota bacterium]|nr:methyltransferase domain-containing protein [Nitrospirota bacterium]
MKRDNTMTKRFLTDAGIAQGMRVIEIGCGGGEVTQILAEMVGSSGIVVAIDRSEDALANASDRMRSLEIGNVQFVSADVTKNLAALERYPRESFDVLAGRRVLMYLQNPAEAVRRLVKWLRSEGVAVFEEADSTMTPARISQMAAHDQATDWLKKMLVAEGGNPSMGFNLPTTLVQAGLRFEKIRAEAVIQGQGTQYPLSALLKLVQSRVIAAGIATETEVNTLAVRLDAEGSDPMRVFVSDMSFCAWGHKP